MGIMKSFILRVLIAYLCLAPFFAAASPAQSSRASGSLRGQVTDPSGAVVVGASVTVMTASGATLSGTSDKLGAYSIQGVPAGSAMVEVRASGFTPYKAENVAIIAGEVRQLNVALEIAVKQEQVTVQGESPNVGVDVSPENNASATILKGKDLEALSDDPDELEQDLLALAGPSAGPNGGQIFIDGFSNGTLPPKSSIREIRINQNPFSAQYDRPGFGRIEVFTKPGTDKWHGQGMFNERNSALNSSNPYAPADSPGYHTERYSGNIGGALGKRSSTFVNFERRDIQELQVVNADVSSTGVFSQAVVAPETRTNFSPRFDVQLSPNNTLTVRYQYLKNDETNQGFGGTTLYSRGDNYRQTQQTVQASDTQVFGTHLINETRFQYIRNNLDQYPTVSGLASINVLGQFGVGESILGLQTDHSNLYELQNYTSWSVGRHFAKFGGRLRVTQDDNFSNAGFNGILTYTGLQSYLSGTPSQLSIVTGTPSYSLSYADVGVYAEDDWKLRSNLTLSYGLRFESQSAIHDKADFGPRVGISWGLGSAKSAPKTVLRVGYGIFFDRFTSDLVMQANRENGTVEQQTIYTAAAASPIQCQPGGYNASGQPTSFAINSANIAASCPVLPASSAASTVYQIYPQLHAPYTMQTAVSVERQLGRVGTVSLTYINSHGVHQLDLRNANAPLIPEDLNSRPDPGQGNVYQYYSEGIFKQNQLIANAQIRISQLISLNGYYALSYAHGDTNGASSNPSNSYRLTDDYGRAAFDIRNRVFLAGTASLAHNIRISPFVIINSGVPFNITTGADNNGDSFFNDRPSFTDCNSSNAVLNQQGKPQRYSGRCFNIAPATGEKLIPVNYGRGDANVIVNLRVSKTVGFGAETKKDANTAQGGVGGGPGGGGPGGGRGGPGGFGGPRGLGSIFGPANTTRRYNLTIAAGARNLFNFWNPGSPIGNLSSTMFGKSNSLAGGPFSSSGTANRIFELGATLSF
jgi:hypothetical protein